VTTFDALRLEETADELLEHAPAGYLSTLADGTVVRVNETFLQWIGAPRAEVLGRRFADLLTPGARAYHETHVSPLLHLRGWVQDVALELRGAEGRRLPVLVNCNAKNGEDGTPVLVRMTVFDATQRMAFERELVRARRAAELSSRRLGILQRAASAFADAASMGQVLSALTRILTDEFPVATVGAWLADEQRPLLSRADRRAAPGDDLAPDVVQLARTLPLSDAFTGREVVAVTAARADELPYPRTSAAMATARVGLLLAVPLLAEGRTVGAYQVAFRRAPDRWADDLDLFRTIGAQAGAAVERARLHDQLHHRATHDSLTDASNRVLLVDRLDRALADAGRTGGSVTVMFMDLDGFKGINDDLGHRAGDELLIEVVRRLRAALRPTDTLARLGGDEFAVLCTGTSATGAEGVAHRLENALRAPFRCQGRTLAVTASIGIVVHDATTGARSATSAELLRRADAAMYLAKATGKDRHVVYDETLEARLVRRAEVEELLQVALDGDGVELHYQPVFDLSGHVATGVEALCRIRDRDGALVMPDEFIDIAEERGLIVQLGTRVLEQACTQVAGWDAAGSRPVTLAVNVAADQAARTDFADEVLAVLARTGFPASRLLLELTESVLLAATDSTLAGLQRLRDEGIGIALDDFGTRYASLHYVQQFPLTALKIDRSFVAHLPGGTAERAIVRSVAQLAHDLGLRCTAEGIETAGQLDFLSGLGVQGQGYVLARPMPADDCRALLAAGHGGTLEEPAPVG
jgi:diguanylate cyclase (GGDEF)-like protein/PAS domain S-box-containing protein